MRLLGVSTILASGVVVGAFGYVAMTHPDTPLPPAWNPSVLLSISESPNLLTGWKLRRAAADVETSLAAMPDAETKLLPPISDGPNCGIDPRVSHSSVGSTAIAPVETTCAVALRLAMWERHTLQPAAVRIFGENVTRIEHFSSYSCREIRTEDGSGGRMSLHATAKAIDINSFELTSGRRLSIFAG